MYVKAPYHRVKTTINIEGMSHFRLIDLPISIGFGVSHVKDFEIEATLIQLIVKRSSVRSRNIGKKYEARLFFVWQDISFAWAGLRKRLSSQLITFSWSPS